MSASLRKLSGIILDQVPTVVALAVLGAVAWWGFVLLNSSPTKPNEEANQKKDEKQEASSDKDGLPLVKVASQEAMAKAGIQPGVVEEKPVREYVEAHGDLDFNQDHYAHLSTRASGTAFSVHKHAGDQVRKGEVLALVAAPELASLKFDLQQTLLTVQTRKKYYERLQSSGESTSRQALESANASLREARIHLSKDQQSLQNLGLSVSVEELSQLSDEQVSDRLRTLGIPPSLLQSLDAGSLTSNLLPMFAPFDGTVIKRDIVKGEMVNPATPQFVLADLSRLWIMLHVRLEDVGKLREGQEVSFHLDGPHEDAPPARIKWISAAVDEKTRTVPVRADVDNPRGRLRPGTFGDARVVVKQEKRLTVPDGALQFDGVSYLVFAQGASETEFQPLRVEIGPRDQGSTAVLSGVKAGQKIAVSGTRVLLSEMQKERIAGED